MPKGLRTIGIVGPGLIGASVAMAAARAWPHVEIAVADRGDPLESIASADVVVISTPVEAIGGILARLAPIAGPQTLVLDTGSTKRGILAAAAAAGLRRFVGGHPMVGDTSSGASAARADLFDGHPWFLMGGPAEARDAATTLVAALGADPVVLDDAGERHDRVMAAVSHLPQVTASALMVVAARAVGADELTWAGAGLRDTTRLAASSAGMWRGVLASNADMLAPLVRQLAADLDTLAGLLDDQAAVTGLFDAARRAKASGL